MLDELMSNLSTIAIALVGLGFIMGGKPKKKTHKIKTEDGEHIYFRKDNFTLKMIKVVIIFVIYFMVKNMFTK